MDVLQDVLRNFTIITNCLRDENEDFLRLQMPELIQHINLFVELLNNNRFDEDFHSLLTNVSEALRRKLAQCHEFLNRVRDNDNISIQMPVILEIRRGRPKYDFSVELINAFIDNGVTWSEMSRIFNVSRRSLFNFRQENQMSIKKHPIIQDAELVQKVVSVKSMHPKAGYRYIWGSLKSQGIFVTWKRPISIVRTIDPVGVYNRQRRRLKRRKYKVKGANYLWHIDGHEKLIHWHFHIHGCIDGYSRKLIYLQASPTKQAATVLNIFMKGVAENGLPMRVRADRGKENFQVMEYMQSSRPDIQTSFIFGRSVHNVRIERIWGEVNRIVCSKFRSIFRSLEEENILYQRSYLDLLCISYVYLPRIQNSLNSFKCTWNHHKLRSESSKSPNVLWLSSLLKLSHEQDLFALHLVPEYLDFNLFGENHAPHLIPSNFDLDVSAFPIDSNIITYFNNIAREIVPNPLLEDGNEGKHFYVTLRNHISNLFQLHDWILNG